MARSLFNLSTLTRGNRSGFAGRYQPEFEEDDYPRARITLDGAGRKRRIKLPWIYAFIGYHLAAVFGVIVAFIAWLIMMAV